MIFPHMYLIYVICVTNDTMAGTGALKSICQNSAVDFGIVMYFLSCEVLFVRRSRSELLERERMTDSTCTKEQNHGNPMIPRQSRILNDFRTTKILLWF